MSASRFTDPFPMHCANCKREIPTFADYLKLEPPSNGVTVLEYPELIEHWRNCPCGGTMVVCEYKGGACL